MRGGCALLTAGTWGAGAARMQSGVGGRCHVVQISWSLGAARSRLGLLGVLGHRRPEGCWLLCWGLVVGVSAGSKLCRGIAGQEGNGNCGSRLRWGWARSA